MDLSKKFITLGKELRECHKLIRNLKKENAALKAENSELKAEADGFKAKADGFKAKADELNDKLESFDVKAMEADERVTAAENALEELISLYELLVETGFDQDVRNEIVIAVNAYFKTFGLPVRLNENELSRGFELRNWAELYTSY